MGVYRSRFGRGLDGDVLGYLSSLGEDLEILFWDLVGSEAHVVMLVEEGIISADHGSRILQVLEELKSMYHEGRLKVGGEYEDIHEFVEGYLVERLGIDVGGRVHIGRSRNDQVALDVRLRVRELLLEVWESVLGLVETLLRRARDERDSIMLLYTHLQQAQVGLLSHYLIAVVDHLLRDLERVKECYRRVNKCPLGASASGGSLLPLNRDRVAMLLGFEGIVENSLDAVGSRDWVLEAASACSIIMTHLSRIAEDLVIWATDEFRYIDFPDELASPSSIMPHKKNPAVVELVRARAGRVAGNLIHIIVSLKSTPTGYSIDLQETKPPLFEALKHTRDSLRIMEKVFSRIIFRREKMLESALRSYAPAVDLAEALVKYSGLSLREAHRVVGEIVRRLVAKGLPISSITVNEVCEVSEKLIGRRVELCEETLKTCLDPRKVVELRATRGSPNPREIDRMTESRLKIVDDERHVLEDEKRRVSNALTRLEERVREIIGGRASP